MEERLFLIAVLNSERLDILAARLTALILTLFFADLIFGKFFTSLDCRQIIPKFKQNIFYHENYEFARSRWIDFGPSCILIFQNHSVFGGNVIFGG